MAENSETLPPGEENLSTLRPNPPEVKRQAGLVPVLTIAGYDPSSGAGITADLQVLAAHGFYGASAITALTVQSSQGVRRLEPVSPDLLRETLECLADDLPLAGVKIGMLATAAAVHTVSGFLCQAGVPREHIVLDPVLRSSSGAELLEPDGVRLLQEKLLCLVGWVTPNVDELAALLQEPTADRSGLPAQARRLQQLAPGLNVIVTGGHLDPPDEFLLTAAGAEHTFPGRRVETSSTHGTGCAFSSALLCRVLRGDTPADAVRHAKAFVTQALETAVPVGQGKGGLLAQTRPLQELAKLSSSRG